MYSPPASTLIDIPSLCELTSLLKSVYDTTKCYMLCRLAEEKITRGENVSAAITCEPISCHEPVNIYQLAWASKTLLGCFKAFRKGSMTCFVWLRPIDKMI
jgi:hypothetical protein